MPSYTISGWLLRNAATVRASSSANSAGVAGVGHSVCIRNRASRPARATLVVPGRRSTATMPARSTFRWRKRGRRPRPDTGLAPSVTQPSAINWATIADTVLRCRPERRASSARDSGW